MRGALSALKTFIAPLEEGQRRPGAKWMRDMAVGMLRSGSVKLTEIGRGLDEEARDGTPRKLIHTVKRLSRNLNSDRFDDDALLDAWWIQIEPHLTRKDGRGVVVGVDYTDVKAPFARPGRPLGLRAACICRDGSKGIQAMGIPIAQIDAVTPGGGRIPVRYEPFKHGTEHASQNQVFSNLIAEVAPHVGDQAWFAFDRGFDGPRIFDAADREGIRWAIRLRIDHKVARTLIMADGSVVRANVAAGRAHNNWVYEETKGRGRKKKTRRIEFASKKVWVKDMYFHGKKARPRGQARTLVAVWNLKEGQKTPMVVLAHEWRPGRAWALEILKAYLKRWPVEESTRFFKAKNGWGLALEDLTVRSQQAVRRMLMLMSMVGLFLETVRRVDKLREGVIGVLRLIYYPAKDLRYRLSRGLGMVLGRAPRWSLERWCRAVLARGT